MEYILQFLCTIGEKMDQATGEVGIIGLGKMGGALALQCREHGWKVAGFTLGGIPADLLDAGVISAGRIADLKNILARPRKIMIYIPAGAAVDHTLNELSQVLEPGDIIADGGNSYWGDSIERHRRLKAAGLHFIDLGTSGGVSGARNGACFMAGGDAEPIRKFEPLLRALAVPGGYVHAGPPGSGHFTKLVHNGIEFGMLQAIGEGINLLEEFPHAKLPIENILKNWNCGSVIRSWLIELMATQYSREGGLQEIPPFVEDTGEVNWLVSDALHMEVPVPVMAQAVMQLFMSRDSSNKSARAIAMMRHGFGGHPFGPSTNIALERKTGRIQDEFLKRPEKKPVPRHLN
jgi:6-phosphogluconate dehydrogenase